MAERHKGKQTNKGLHSKIIAILQAKKRTPDEIVKLCDCGRSTAFRVKKEIVASISSIGR